MDPDATPDPGTDAGPGPEPALDPRAAGAPGGGRRGGAPLARRRFLLGAGGALAGAAVGAGAWRALVAERSSGAAGTAQAVGSTGTVPTAADTVLVVVQLGGGNDALNALVPADGRYLDARPTLGVREADRLVLAGEPAYGLHPALAPLVPAWEAGELAVVAGTGIEGQSRSHFQALDTWWSARPGEVRSTGWLGRWLDATVDQDPDNPLRAVALGAGAPALLGERSTATVVLDPAAFRLRAPAGVDAGALAEAWLATAAPLAEAPLLAAAQQVVPTTVTATDRLAGAFADVADAAGPAVGDGVPATPITDLLRTAAAVLDHDLGTRVVHVGAGGFDTHADQAGTHPALLADLAGGLAELRAAAAAGGWADRLLVVTVSDFGRRVAENGSGTDHGFGGLQLVGGTAVDGGRVVGALDLGALRDGDLPPVLDGRSVYAAALDWLGGPTDEVLGGPFDRHDLVVT